MKDRIKAFWHKKMSDKALRRHTWMTWFGVIGMAMLLLTPGRGNWGNWGDGTWWTPVSVAGLAWSVYQIWWIVREKKRRGLNERNTL